VNDSVKISRLFYFRMHCTKLYHCSLCKSVPITLYKSNVFITTSEYNTMTFKRLDVERSFLARGDIFTSGVTRGRTAPWTPSRGWRPNEKKLSPNLQQWTNEVGQVKKVRGDTLQGGDTRVKSKKVTGW